MAKGFLGFIEDYAEYADCAGSDFTYESIKSNFSDFSVEGANRYSANSAAPAEVRVELHFDKSRFRHEASLDEGGLDL